MDWEKLKTLNKSFDTTNIKGKAYVEVNKRVLAFRELEPNGQIKTEILSNDGNVVVMKATVTDRAGNILGTGHAYEDQKSSTINKTSYIENCETSAVGRALGMCGIGIDGSIASAEEVDMAIKKQEMLSEPISVDNLATASEKKVFYDMCDLLQVDYKVIAKEAGAKSMSTMTKEQHGKALIALKKLQEKK